MTYELHLRFAGILQIGLAAFHVFFPRRFHWKEAATGRQRAC